MISVTSLTKHYGAQVLFSGVTLQFDPGRRYGIVGANGVGKSTFLRLLSGQETPDGGEINIPSRVRMGTLTQDHFAFEAVPLVEVVLHGRPELAAAITEKDRLLEQPEPPADRLVELEEIIAHHDGYVAESRIGEMLEGLGIPGAKHLRTMRELSGGYKLRVLLAQCLFSRPDVLLLDEPTNHLDIISIRWLEGYLRDYAGVVLAVSHDREFLNNICTDIADIDYGTIKIYSGNYDRYLVAREQEMDLRRQEAAKAEKRIDDLQHFVTRFKGKASKARQAQSKAKQIERLEKTIEAPVYSSRKHPLISFTGCRPSGKTVLEVSGLKKSFGENRVLDGVDFTVYRGDRIAVIGPNGIGKSTLLKIVMGELKADGGSYSWGYETHPDYFSQDHRDIIPSNSTPYEFLYQFDPGASISAIRGLLGNLLFSGDDVHKKTTALSGGEAARLVLAKLVLTHGNVLVLDEPSNHLDLESIEAFVDALLRFDGTIILVSHNRYIVDRVATKILELRPGEADLFTGSYREFLERAGTDHLRGEAPDRPTAMKDNAPAAAAAGGAGKRKKDKNRGGTTGSKVNLRPLEEKLRRCEEEIAGLEAAGEELDALFARPEFFSDSSPQTVQQKTRERQAYQERLQELYRQWEAAGHELEAKRRPQR
ncbi:MAG: ABC-F family ATP-binding cassette domain-containing protein [Deltaproteobacteria bacterium]|nr:ABC-F family ATP-binding cassette domain-containing protein [Candidatus Anaeroferrophillacea bacterium]